MFSPWVGGANFPSENLEFPPVLEILRTETKDMDAIGPKVTKILRNVGVKIITCTEELEAKPAEPKYWPN